MKLITYNTFLLNGVNGWVDVVLGDKWDALEHIHDTYVKEWMNNWYLTDIAYVYSKAKLNTVYLPRKYTMKPPLWIWSFVMNALGKSASNCFFFKAAVSSSGGPPPAVSVELVVDVVSSSADVSPSPSRCRLRPWIGKVGKFRYILLTPFVKV